MATPDRVRPRVIDLALVIGVVMMVYGTFVMLATSSLVVRYELPVFYPFDLPGYEFGVSLYPEIRIVDGDVILSQWVERLFRGAVYFVAWSFYYMGFAGFVTGVVTIFAGLASTQRAAALRVLQRYAGDRRFQVFTVWIALVVGLIATPAALEAFIHGSAIVTVWLGLATTLGVISYRIYRRGVSPAWVFVVYPLVVAIPLLSSVATAFLVPWASGRAGPVSVSLAVSLVRLLFDPPVSIAIVRRLGAEPAIIFQFWTAVTVGAGWLLGLTHLATAYGRGNLDIPYGP